MVREKVEVNGVEYEVFYRHMRYGFDGLFAYTSTARKIKADGDEIWAKGGYTECFLTPADGPSVTAFAECNEKDNFNKKIGRDISRGRAIASIKRNTAIYA